MKKSILFTGAGMAASAVLLMASSAAMAHGRVDWSISVGAPMYYPPPVTYVQPQVVYVQPEPVYEVRPPVVRYRPQPYYVYSEPYWREREWHEREWHEHHRRHYRD